MKEVDLIEVVSSFISQNFCYFLVFKTIDSENKSVQICLRFAAVQQTIETTVLSGGCIFLVGLFNVLQREHFLNLGRKFGEFLKGRNKTSQRFSF